MKLEEILNAVESSSAADWDKLDTKVVHDLEACESGGVRYIELNKHTGYIVLRANVDISIAYGATYSAEFSELWTEKFVKSASSVHVTLRFRGCPIQEWIHVFVDGYRHLLPMPLVGEAGEYFVPPDTARIGKLMFDINRVDIRDRSMEQVLSHCGVELRR